MNKCKPFVGYHDPETCVWLNPIPGVRPMPTEDQLREQWEAIEDLLTIAALRDTETA